MSMDIRKTMATMLVDLKAIQEKLWLMETQDTMKIIAQWQDVILTLRELTIEAENAEDELRQMGVTND